MFGFFRVAKTDGGNGVPPDMHVYCIQDEKTGVNYLIAAQYEGGVFITPRLNADGSLFVTSVRQENGTAK